MDGVVSAAFSERIIFDGASLVCALLPPEKIIFLICLTCESEAMAGASGADEETREAVTSRRKPRRPPLCGSLILPIKIQVSTPSVWRGFGEDWPTLCLSVERQGLSDSWPAVGLSGG